MFRALTLGLAAAAALGCAHAQTSGADAGAILESFAADYARDPYLDRETVFGVEVEGAWWTVSATPARAGAPAQVRVTPGTPPAPTFYFTVDRETLARIGAGELNALTAMGKAQDSDAAPMDLQTMEGYAPSDPGFGAWIIPFAFHFWTRGQPEIIPFGPDATRTVHGAQAAVLFYQEGFRSAFVEVRPGQHVNADPRDQVNPFPTLLIMTEGRAMGRIGGRDVELTAGNAVLIPAGVTHEFTNPFDAPAQAILLMFGEGA